MRVRGCVRARTPVYTRAPTCALRVLREVHAHGCMHVRVRAHACIPAQRTMMPCAGQESLTGSDIPIFHSHDLCRYGSYSYGRYSNGMPSYGHCSYGRYLQCPI